VENQEEIKVLESKEVWYATTKEYDLKIGENKYLVRVAEDSNGVEYLILDLDSGEWADLEEGSHGKDGDLIVEALNDNALD
jgi:hypothetical protein